MKLNIKGTIVPNDYKHVYDYFGIESTSAKDVSDALDAANGQPLEVYINSGGGYVHAGQDGSIYVSELARAMRQPMPAVSRGLRAMEQDGHITRETDPGDRRKTLVRITPKGYELCHQCEQALRNYFASVLARLEPEQAAQMDALRGALMDAILAENAARNIDPKGETNHDKDL